MAGNKKRLVYLASKYPRMGTSVTQTFQNSQYDAKSNRTVYTKDLDFRFDEVGNDVSNDKLGVSYYIHIHDLDATKRYDSEKKKEAVTLEEFLEATKTCLKDSWDGGHLFIVAHKDSKKEIKDLVDAGVLSKGKVLPELILEKVIVNADPFADIDPIIDDSEVQSLADIRSKAVKAAEEKKLK